MSGKNIKIYHVETQEDYDDLMVELEEQGYGWRSDDKPTKYTPLTKPPLFIFCRDNQRKEITVGTKGNVEECYLKKVVRYKAKGVKQMEKVVVPQFVADWFERNKKGHTIYGLLHLFSDNYYSLDGFRKWVEDYNLKEEDAQEIIAKMYLYQEYEVEEKKCYWRKKKEYFLEFEHRHHCNYINLDTEENLLFFGSYKERDRFRTKFTETEIKTFVNEQDFDKLEKVEITE